jgi:hypothetical protein
LRGGGFGSRLGWALDLIPSFRSGLGRRLGCLLGWALLPFPSFSSGLDSGSTALLLVLLLVVGEPLIEREGLDLGVALGRLW